MECGEGGGAHLVQSDAYLGADDLCGDKEDDGREVDEGAVGSGMLAAPQHLAED